MARSWMLIYEPLIVALAFPLALAVALLLDGGERDDAAPKEVTEQDPGDKTDCADHAYDYPGL